MLRIALAIMTPNRLCGIMETKNSSPRKRADNKTKTLNNMSVMHDPKRKNAPIKKEEKRGK
jgi:hypothetical protein